MLFFMYGKFIKEVKGFESVDGKMKEVWVILYFWVEGGVGGLGWLLLVRRVI